MYRNRQNDYDASMDDRAASPWGGPRFGAQQYPGNAGGSWEDDDRYSGRNDFSAGYGQSEGHWGSRGYYPSERSGSRESQYRPRYNPQEGPYRNNPQGQYGSGYQGGYGSGQYGGGYQGGQYGGGYQGRQSQGGYQGGQYGGGYGQRSGYGEYEGRGQSGYGGSYSDDNRGGYRGQSGQHWPEDEGMGRQTGQYGYVGSSQYRSNTGGSYGAGYGQSGYGQSSYGQGAYGGSQTAWPRSTYMQGDTSPIDAYDIRESGYSSSSQRRSPKGYTRSDERIREDVNDRLMHERSIDPGDIEVTVENGEVTLKGEVANRHEKFRAEQIAESVSGVKDVSNNLRCNRRDERQTSSSVSEQNRSRSDSQAESKWSNTGSGATSSATTGSGSSTGTTSKSGSGSATSVR